MPGYLFHKSLIFLVSCWCLSFVSCDLPQRKRISLQTTDEINEDFFHDKYISTYGFESDFLTKELAKEDEDFLLRSLFTDDSYFSFSVSYDYSFSLEYTAPTPTPTPTPISTKPPSHYSAMTSAPSLTPSSVTSTRNSLTTDSKSSNEPTLQTFFQTSSPTISSPTLLPSDNINGISFASEESKPYSFCKGNKNDKTWKQSAKKEKFEYYYKVELQNFSSLSFLKTIQEKVVSIIMDDICDSYKRRLNAIAFQNYLGIRPSGEDQLVNEPYCEPGNEGATHCYFVKSVLEVLMDKNVDYNTFRDGLFSYIKKAFMDSSGFTEPYDEIISIEFSGLELPRESIESPNEVVNRDKNKVPDELLKYENGDKIHSDLGSIVGFASAGTLFVFAIFLGAKKYYKKRFPTSIKMRKDYATYEDESNDSEDSVSSMNIEFVDGRAKVSEGPLKRQCSVIVEEGDDDSEYFETVEVEQSLANPNMIMDDSWP